jgi:CHAD domain-containing protein
VSARKLLTSLELMTDLDPDSGLEPEREALAGQFKAMGALRDTQVQLEEVEAMALPKARRKALRRALRKRERRLGTAVLDTAGASQGEEIRRVCNALASARSDPGPNRRLRSSINRELKEALLRAKRLRPRSPSGLGRLHRARIALKRLRYLTELVRPVAPDADKALSKRLACCQTLMGDIHDAEVLMARLEKWEAKGRIAGAELRRARAPLARRHRALVRKYFRTAHALFAGNGPLVQIDAG